MGNTACGAKRRQALANRRLGAAAAADSNIAASSQYSDTSGQYSSGYGGGGGGGYVYAMMCPEGIDQDIALAATAAALAVGIYVVYRQITLQTGGRKRRALIDKPVEEDVKFWDSVYAGLEEFEDKVDKIANGQDDNSWIGQLYQQFSSNIGIDGSKIDDDDIGDKDGLEPPILDETWGLEDIHKLHESEEENSDEPRSISKRDVKDNQIQNDEDDVDDGNLDVISDLMGLEGESKCKARLFSCLGNVAKGSMHYMNEPGGVTGALQKVFFRVAFHGGIGNVWKALMTIPEARKIKRCMNKQDDCMAFEVLRKEVETLDGNGERFISEEQRLLINPEFVESMDNSDGSEKFSPEDQAIEDASTDY